MARDYLGRAPIEHEPGDDETAIILAALKRRALEKHDLDADRDLLLRAIKEIELLRDELRKAEEEIECRDRAYEPVEV